MQLTKNFFDYEFSCPCCGRLKMDKSFLDQLQKARDTAQIPFVITSGYRCENHNRKVGGKSDSSHLVGRAADIETSSSLTRFLVIFGLTIAGFKRIGISKNFVHVDNDPSKPFTSMWLY